MRLPELVSPSFECSVVQNSQPALAQLALADAPSCDNLYDCRTLSTIIVSCLATLAACTWVSVHPNIPDFREGQLVLFLRRFRLMVLALVAPEVIVLWALRQRMVARRLAKGVKCLPLDMLKVHI